MNSLIQDVVYAKQRQQGIDQKVKHVDTVLNAEKSKFLQSEANRLVAELSAQKEARASEILKADVKIQTPSSQEVKTEPKTDNKLPFPWQKIIAKDKTVKAAPAKLQPKPKPQEPAIRYGENPVDWIWPHFGYKEGRLSDAEAAYKVAVSDNKITLKEAEEIGLLSSIQIQAVKKRIDVARSKVTEAKRALFPTVQAELFDGDGKQPQNSGDDRYRIFRTEYYKVNINQPLFYGGELLFTIKQAEENLRSAQAEYEKTKAEVLQNIRSAFYGLVKAEYNVQYQNEIVEIVTPLYKRLREEKAQKVISEIDYLNAESQYYQVTFQAESAKNDLLSADMVFHQALDLDVEAKLPVDLKLNLLKINLEFKEVLKAALEKNPDILIKAFAMESAKYGVEIFKAKKLPRFDLRASYGKLGERIWDDKTFTDISQTGGMDEFGAREVDFNKEKEWFVMVKGSMPLGPNSVEWERVKHVYAPTVISPTGGSEDWGEKWTFNLMDRFADLTDQKSAEAALLQARSDYEKSKNDVTLKLRDEFYNMQKSLIQIDSSMAKMRYQEKQNNVQEYLMRMQETPAATYIEGLIEQAQDKFSFIQAVTDYHLAISNLSIAIGDPYYFDRT